MRNSSERVWDLPVRLFHWSLVGVTTAAWFTGDATSLAHEVLGYVALALIAARLAWGRAGNAHARLAAFVRGPSETIRYAGAVLADRAPRYLGHNPLGGWMVVALLACIGALSITGALYTTDWLWGYGWLAKLHEVLGWILVGLVGMHLCGVLFTSWKHRENLVGAMITGRKRPAEPGDIE